MLSYDGTNLKTIAYVGTVSVVLTVVFILVTIVIYGWFHNRLTSGPMYTVSTVEIDKLNGQQQQKLDEYRIVDRERGIVAIPIDAAMKRVVAELSTDPATVTPDQTDGTVPEGGGL